MNELPCFKAYDVRGKLGSQINADIAYRIGRAFAQYMNAKNIVVGGDVRLTSEELKLATARGIMDAGANVIDLGVSGSEEVYFGAMHLDVDGGIEVTASHNPMDYNGMKFIGRDARPIGGIDSDLGAIKTLAETSEFADAPEVGTMSQTSLLDQYVDHLFTYFDTTSLAPLKLVVNSGNGAAGRVVDAIEARLAGSGCVIELIKIHHQPDGNFPNGIPNPLLPENRHSTAQAVIDHKADFGLAWDGDFDRCFFFDEKGEFIEGYYIVGLLAQAMLAENPGKKIIYDPRLIWNTIDLVNASGGVPIVSKTGHSFIKQAMRREDAIYGGEMSAHHYFRDFGFCDSGMIPWLLILQLVSKRGCDLSQLVSERIRAFPCSGEINYQVSSTDKAISKVREYYQPGLKDEVPHIETLDGLSMAFKDWRLNIRASNTEPVLRLNVEAKGDPLLVRRQVEKVEEIIAEFLSTSTG